MNYTDGVEKSGEFMRLALYHMGQHKIPIDPLNYTVWYEHVSGRNDELSQAISAVLKENREFTTQINRNLYKEYIQERNMRLVEKVRCQIRKVLLDLVGTGGDISTFAAVMQGYADQLQEDDMAADDVSRILDGIIEETRTIKGSSSNLKERFFNATQEMESLRKDLDEVQRQASTDGLTGLSNRRVFESRLAREALNSKQSKQPLCLIMVDIDHFKRVNDTYGHLVGDMVLKQAAELLQSSVKGRDMVARYGGEEFMLILPDTPLAGAVTVAEKICDYFQRNEWKRRDNEQRIGPVTVSQGVALYKYSENLDDFIKRVDDALYRSKTCGRNRVSVEQLD